MAGTRYDEAYFRRWYRTPRTRVYSPTEVERRVRFTVATAELMTNRPVRRVLDVCCGMGAWMPALARVRPRARYVGVDSSAYAVERYGQSRHIRFGRFGELATLDLRGPFDLIVCAGALYYLEERELRSGLRAIAGLLGGVAFLEIFTAGDVLDGDVRDIRRRSATWWRRMMRAARLTPIGMHCWVGADRALDLTRMERAPDAAR